MPGWGAELIDRRSNECVWISNAEVIYVCICSTYSITGNSSYSSRYVHLTESNYVMLCTLLQSALFLTMDLRECVFYLVLVTMTAVMDGCVVIMDVALCVCHQYVL